jgi:putative ABC transport system permease protein
LKPGVTLAQAQGEMGAITGRLEREFPGTNRDMKVLSLREKVVGNVRPALLALFGAVGFVLLIACANVSHMLLARSAARQRESALRSALGARHWDLVRQFLTEGLLLASAGGCAGLLLAMWGVRVLLALAPANIPRVETVDIDARVLLFAASISLLSGLVFGVAPVWRVNAANLSEALKKTERGSSEEASQGRWRGLLIGSEYALAVVLLAGAGLMIRTFLALQNVDPGFDPVNVLSMVVGVGGTTEATSGHTGNFYQEVLQRVSAVPGIESASAINHLPLAGDEWGRSFHVEGSPPKRPGNAPIATYRAVFPGYFHTMQIPMLRGRDVAEADNLSASAVIVINEYLAHQYWPGEDPIGKRITFDDPAKSPVWLTVVGIVKNTVRTNWVDRPEEEVFLPYLQTRAYLENPSPPFAYFTLVVRANGDPSALAPAIQAAVHSVDRNVPVSEVQTMEHVAAAATGLSRFYLVLLGTFAAVALALAGVGIYGVMSYSVSRRVREIGIRMALGAERREVIRMVIRQGMLSALFGLAVGLVAAWGLTRLLGNVLYSVRPADPEAFVFASAALALVAFGASYIPARRAARVDPIVALRYE